MRRLFTAFILLALGGTLAAVFGIQAILGSGFGLSAGSTALAAQMASCTDTGTGGGVVVPIDTSKAPSQWTAEQKANAGAIVEQVKAEPAIAAGDKMQAAIIALATSMQESGLKNIGYGDAAGPDSRGLFQQRAAWGPLADRMDPHKAAHMFLTGGQGGQRGLTGVPGWQNMPVWEAAQSVQVSAFPMAYAKWEAAAVALAQALMTAPTVGDPVTMPTVPTQPIDLCGGGGGAPGGSAPAPGSPEIEAMLKAAYGLLGVPYVSGGTTPAGVDCSGLIVYAYEKIGHPLRIRVSEQMWADSTEVPAGQEKRGDLIFMEFHGGGVANGPGPGHVMIVWDPVKKIALEAPHTGDVVKLLNGYNTLGGVRYGRLNPSAFASQGGK